MAMSSSDMVTRLKARMNGKKLVPDQEQIDRVKAELESRYPYASVVIQEGNIDAAVSASTVDYTCMVCGTKLVNVTHEKYDKKLGKWVPRKTRPSTHYHSAMCPTCDPTRGGVPLVIIQGVDMKEEDTP